MIVYNPSNYKDERLTFSLQLFSTTTYELLEPVVTPSQRQSVIPERTHV